MCRCFECGRYARKLTMISTCAQTRTRSRTSVASPSPNRPDRPFETGDHRSGHSLRPSAIRDACQSRSVVTIPAIRARIRSASPRWLPSKRAGRWTLRMSTAPITPSSTSSANTSTISANQPWWPSHGSVAWRLTAPIIAIRIVGKSTRKPQKIAAWIRPGTRRWSSFFWPSTITASFFTRSGTLSKRSTGLASRTRSTSSFARRPKSVPPMASTAASASAPSATAMGVPLRSGLRLSQLGRDRRDDLGQVADHGVVRVREDCRLAIGVDREDLLRALAARDVLRRPADAAGDVEVGGHLRAGLPDLVGVRAPARARHHARAAHGRIEEPGELLEDAEPVSRSHAPASAHHHLRLGERDAGGHRVLVSAHAHDLFTQVGLEALDVGRSPIDGRGLDHVRGDRDDLEIRVDARLFEEAPTPAHPGDAPVAPDRGAVGGEGQIAARAEVSEHLVAPVRARGHHRGRLDAVDELVEARGPRARGVGGELVVLGHVHGLDAVCAQLGGLEGQRVHGPAETARKRQRLERELLCGLDEDQDAHPATPISRIIWTTAGAASGPSPRISACFPWPGGTTRRCFSSRAAGRSGVTCSTGFERARSFAGTAG